MRTGEIKTAEPIPGAKKLLKLTVDIGTEVRQVCAGIAEFYAPEKLIGMKVVVVTNLQPRKLRGVESNGMIVAASVGDQGRPVLVTFGEDVPNESAINLVSSARAAVLPSVENKTVAGSPVAFKVESTSPLMALSP